jgi:peptide/nickel transport system permease protein
MNVLRAVGVRVVDTVAALVAISLAVFALGTLVPGNIALQVTGTEGATPQHIAQVRKSLGLDRPFFSRYWHWLTGALHGNFGVSPISGRPIGPDLMAALPVSFEVACLGMFGALLFGVPIGVLAATHKDSWLDRVLRGTSLALLSIPTFLLAALLVLLGARYFAPLYSSFYVRPTQNLGENLRSVFLPALSIALSLTGIIAQMTRASLAEVLGLPFITSARAHGIPEREIRYVHGLKPALNPVVTLSGVLLGTMVGGLIVTERVFNLPGLGSMLVSSIGNRDFMTVVPATMIIVVVYVVLNALVDLLYPLLDPRLRRG